MSQVFKGVTPGRLTHYLVDVPQYKLDSVGCVRMCVYTCVRVNEMKLGGHDSRSGKG